MSDLVPLLIYGTVYPPYFFLCAPSGLFWNSLNHSRCWVGLITVSPSRPSLLVVRKAKESTKTRTAGGAWRRTPPPRDMQLSKPSALIAVIERTHRGVTRLGQELPGGLGFLFHPRLVVVRKITPMLPSMIAATPHVVEVDGRRKTEVDESSCTITPDSTHKHTHRGKESM